MVMPFVYQVRRCLFTIQPRSKLILENHPVACATCTLPTLAAKWTCFLLNTKTSRQKYYYVIFIPFKNNKSHSDNKHAYYYGNSSNNGYGYACKRRKFFVICNQGHNTPEGTHWKCDEKMFFFRL